MTVYNPEAFGAKPNDGSVWLVGFALGRFEATTLRENDAQSDSATPDPMPQALSPKPESVHTEKPEISRKLSNTFLTPRNP